MRNLFTYTLLLLSLFTSCQPKNNPVLTLNMPALQLEVGQRATLEVSPAWDDVVWTSSNPEVASVFYGVVTAISNGTTTITAQAKGQTAECFVLVAGEPVTELTLLSEQYMEIEKGEKDTIRVKGVPDRPLQWVSYNEEVATVEPDGVVTALETGSTTISIYDGYTELKVTVVVPKHFGEYALVWTEDFDAPELDTQTWTYEIGGGGWGNNEKQYYTDRPENVRIEDGLLIIQAKKESYKGSDYTSARIKTQGKKSFKYGKIEARISLPSGGGSWPAFWMMGDNYATAHWPACGELDIMEHVGNQPTMISYAIHTTMKNGSRGNNWSARTYQDEVENNFHVYGVRWEESEHFGCDRITFTYDGEDKATVLEDLNHIDDAAYWPFNQPFFFILNVAVGGNFGGNIDDNAFNQDVMMKVDWIHVYQQEIK